MFILPTARKTTTETMKTAMPTKTTTQWVILLQIRHPVEKKKKDKTTAQLPSLYNPGPEMTVDEQQVSLFFRFL